MHPSAIRSVLEYTLTPDLRSCDVDRLLRMSMRALQPVCRLMGEVQMHGNQYALYLTSRLQLDGEYLHDK